MQPLLRETVKLGVENAIEHDMLIQCGGGKRREAHVCLCDRPTYVTKKARRRVPAKELQRAGAIVGRPRHYTTAETSTPVPFLH